MFPITAPQKPEILAQKGQDLVLAHVREVTRSVNSSCIRLKARLVEIMVPSFFVSRSLMQ